VRVEVLVRGKVERAASGVVVANEGDTSYVLTNEHVVQREGLSGNASFQVVWRGRSCAGSSAGHRRSKVPTKTLPCWRSREALTPAQIVARTTWTWRRRGAGRSSVRSRPERLVRIVSQLEVDEQDPRVQRAMKTDAPIGYGAPRRRFHVPSGRLVGLVEGYRTAKWRSAASEGRVLFESHARRDVPRAACEDPRFRAACRIGKLAGLKEGARGRDPRAGDPMARGH